MTHICICKLTIIGSDDGSDRRQAIIWTNEWILLIQHLEQTSAKYKAEFIHFHSRKCIWKCRLQNDIHFVLASMCKHISAFSWDMLLICTTEMYLQIMFQNYAHFPMDQSVELFIWLNYSYLCCFSFCGHNHVISWLDLITYIHFTSYLLVSCNSCKGSVSIYSNCGISNVYMTFLCCCCLLWWKWGRMLAFTWMPWSCQMWGGVMSVGVSYNKEEGDCI